MSLCHPVAFISGNPTLTEQRADEQDVAMCDGTDTNLIVARTNVRRIDTAC